MWIVVALLLLLAAGVVILWPYLRPREALPTAAEAVALDPRLAELYEQREMLYKAIRDARFDLEMGKLSPADYEQQETKLKWQAAAVLRAIDELEQNLFSPQLDARLEAEIAAVRAAGLTPAEDEAIERAVQAARGRNGGGVRPKAPAATGPAVGDRFCGHCGAELRPGDRFCGQCGQAVRGGRW
ncbi:MAG: zinc ribbon domain-containing protein [Caldilineales bacterium]|nr:zinc ribbon domain-containing protein [Caldilineales bacterium]